MVGYRCRLCDHISSGATNHGALQSHREHRKSAHNGVWSSFTQLPERVGVEWVNRPTTAGAICPLCTGDWDDVAGLCPRCGDVR